jgi:hypothetical protein
MKKETAGDLHKQLESTVDRIAPKGISFLGKSFLKRKF